MSEHREETITPQDEKRRMTAAEVQERRDEGFRRMAEELRNPMTRVQRRCISCGMVVEFEVPEEGFKEWKAGELIQNAMPEVGEDERELLISGICGQCFDRMR